MADLGRALIDAATNGQLRRCGPSSTKARASRRGMTSFNARRSTLQQLEDTWRWQSCSLTAGPRSTL